LSPHPDHHRIVNVTLEHEALLGFLHEVRKVDVQNLDRPLRYELASALAKHVGEDFATTINGIVKDRQHGGFTVGLQGLTADAEDFVRFGTAVGHLLGPGNHDAMSGTYYARFVVKHTDNSDSYLRQAYRLFTMHTDGTFVSEATDWLLMMKFAEQNARAASPASFIWTIGKSLTGLSVTVSARSLSLQGAGIQECQRQRRAPSFLPERVWAVDVLHRSVCAASQSRGSGISQRPVDVDGSVVGN
jgi:hypothetical protein